MKVPISILIPTKNEQENIVKCLQSVSWADEIYVIDSHSADQTASLARSLGAEVIDFQWDGIGPRKRNWALRNLPWKHEWLLLLDADEEVSPALGDEMARAICSSSSIAGYLIRFHYFFLGRKLTHGDPLWKLCLVRHRLAQFESVNVPEVTGYDVELHEWVRLDGPIGRLRSVIVHRDFQNLYHHFQRHNIYSDWEALLRTRHRHRNLSGEVLPRLFGSPVERRRFWKRLFLALPGRPWLYFLYSYLLRGGFLDGGEGLQYNVLKSFYWYQVRLKELELRRTDVLSSATREGSKIGGSQRSNQLAFYRESVDPEEEITRPRCYPRPVQYLLDFKISTAWSLLNGNSSPAADALRSVLVVCCGSGMESEMVARAGRRVVALDLSLDALLRARERGRRFGVTFDLVVGDTESLPFRDSAFDYVFVHDGLHHLPDAYGGVREMLRVARRAAIIAEPADAALTRLSVKLGISGEYEDAGNYVYRLDPAKLTALFRAEGLLHWRFRRNLVYYQPWTFPFYRLFEKRPLFDLFRLGFRFLNLFFGRWGNSLRAVAWKPTSQKEAESQ